MMKLFALVLASSSLFVAVSAFVTPATRRLLQPRSISSPSLSPPTTTSPTQQFDYLIRIPAKRIDDAPRSFVARSSSKSSINEGSPKKKQKSRLSRPERKALERAKKGNDSNNNNSKKNGKSSSSPSSPSSQQPQRRYDLHSTAISELTKDSSPEDVIRAMKRAQKNHDSHDLRVITRFLLEETDDSFAYGFKGSLLARLAVAALHLQHHTVAREAITKRRVDFRSSMLPLESAALVRNLLRVHNVTDAWNVLEDELSLPLEGTLLTDPSNRDRLKYRALALASIASRHFFGHDPHRAVYACSRIADLGPLLYQAQIKPEDLELPWSRLLRGASQCQSALRSGEVDLDVSIKKRTAEHQRPVNGDASRARTEHNRRAEQLPCNLVYAVLDAMLSVPSTNGDREYEILSNSLVRRVVFVTGAINMEGCPPADRGEAAFVGRSNVGKSSLVNMVTNRKSLAYTSKRPGKTQQFNFFAVNDKPGREKEIKYGDQVDGEKDEDAFYIVDLPGFGYAKVPDQQRQQWAEFMDEYISSRENLRVLFHLVDGRHGATDEDKTIMKRVSNILPPHVRYVVVLTKADKNVKGPNKTNTGKVSLEIQNDLKQAMQENGVGYAPVVLTSAETKLGRDGVWNYFRLAAER